MINSQRLRAAFKTTVKSMTLKSKEFHVALLNSCRSQTELSASSRARTQAQNVARHTLT